MVSDNARSGMQQAPARSLFNALGFTAEEMKKPMIGIVSSYNEIVPGHMNIDKIVNAVKLGVAEAGGVPVVFPAIAVCDGIAMGHVGMKYSLVTRDLIADSTEGFHSLPRRQQLQAAKLQKASLHLNFQKASEVHSPHHTRMPLIRAMK